MGYVRPYSVRIAVSVALLAMVGACYGLFALLLEPLLDRFLNPNPSADPVELVRLPFTDFKLELDDLLPFSGNEGFGLFCAVFLGVSVI